MILSKPKYRQGNWKSFEKDLCNVNIPYTVIFIDRDPQVINSAEKNMPLFMYNVYY